MKKKRSIGCFILTSLAALMFAIAAIGRMLGAFEFEKIVFIFMSSITLVLLSISFNSLEN